MPKHLSTIVMIVGFLALLTGCENPSAPASGTASPNPAPLQLSYDDALAKGVAAARAQQFQQAADFFHHAHQANPASPEALFDLGLAEAKIPGRELRAMAWFQAYLALSPDAPNAATVREQIKNLDTAAQANAGTLTRIIASATTDSHRELCYAAYLAGASGDIGWTTDLSHGCGEDSDYGMGGAEGLAKSLHFGAAINIAQIKKPDNRSDLFAAVAGAAIRVGQLAEAKQAIDLKAPVDRGDYDRKDTTLLKLDLAVATYKAGQQADAATLLSDARKGIDGSSPFDVQCELASVLYRTGNQQAAETLFHQLLGSARSPVQLGDKMANLLPIATTAYVLGHTEEASALFKEGYNDGVKAEQAGDIEPLNLPMIDEVQVEDWRDARTSIDADHTDNKPLLELIYRRGVADHAMERILDRNTPADQRAQSWSEYIESGLADPIFIDFAAAVQSMKPPYGNYYSSSLADALGDTFNLFKTYVDRLAEIRAALSLRTGS